MYMYIYVHIYAYIYMRTVAEDRLYRVCRVGRRVCRQHPYVDLFTDLRIHHGYDR